MAEPTTPMHTTYDERIAALFDRSENYGMQHADAVTEHRMQVAYDRAGSYYTALEIGLPGPYDQGQTTLLFVSAIADDPESGMRLQGRTGNGVITYELRIDNTTPETVWSATIEAALADLATQIHG